MKVSYNWLCEYVENMPPVEQVVDALTMHSFEIEGVEDGKNGDKILDVKILPNRSHDCLSHYGIASEIASVCGLTRKPLLAPVAIEKKGKIKVSLDTNLCKRGVAIYITGLNIGDSPEWLKEKLSSMGQRPINSIVDITNYLMYACGQPMHAFDANKIGTDWLGNKIINIRTAKKGEKITLLNTKEYELDTTVMVLADKDHVLDVAGVMGGAETGVTTDGEHPTKDIVLTLCNFDAVSIRKTSKNLGVRTDASQRFENDISSVLIDRVLPYALKIISEIAGGEIVAHVDEYSNKQKQTIITVTAEKISAILGTDMSAEKIIELLARQQISAEFADNQIKVTVPLERLDLTLVEDIAEEVGRLYGYEHVVPVQLPVRSEREINPIHYVVNKIREVLSTSGFSEVYTYTFANAGDVEIENPLASDKKFLRRNLATAMEASLEQNFKYLDLIGIRDAKLFEIGSVFQKRQPLKVGSRMTKETDGEFLHLSLGVKYPKGTKSHVVDEEITKAIQAIEFALGISIGNVSVVGGQAEIDLQRILDEVTIPTIYPDEFWKLITPNVLYKSISQYPFAVRDVAVFVPSDKTVDEIKKLIADHLTLIVVRFSLFDTFVKTDQTTGTSRTSYAFRLVFQSLEKTLTDEDINAVMNSIYDALKSQEGFEIR